MSAAEHNYGRAISFKWRPLANDTDVAAYSLVSARLYGPNVEPTQAQKENSAPGHVDEQTTWAAIDKGLYEITFDAQVDATPSSANRYDTFYVVVTFTYESGGAEVYDEEILYLYRPDSLTSWIDITVDDIYALEPRLAFVVATNQEVDEQIKLAIEDIIARLKAEGYDKHRLFNLQEFNPCAKRWACSYVCYSLEGEGNPHWATKGKRWEERAEQLYKSTVVGYDLTDNDKPGPTEKRFSGAVAVVR